MTCLCRTKAYPFYCIGRKVRVHSPEEHAACPGVSIPGGKGRFYNGGTCGRRGESLGTMKGNLCGGNHGMCAVYRCSKHGKCSDTLVRNDVRSCETCRDHTGKDNHGNI